MEHLAVLNLNYRSGFHTVKLAKGDIIFWVDGLEFKFPTIHAARIVSIISDAHPRTILTEELFDHLSAIVHIGDRSMFSQTVYKYVSQARLALAKAGVEKSLIQTVRNLGYRLGQGWSVHLTEEPSLFFIEALFELRSLIDKCISRAWTCTMITNSSGIMYLDVNKEDAYNNVIILDNLSWRLLKAMSILRPLHPCLQMKEYFDKMMSYVLYRRIGEGISEHTWRLLYEKELNFLYGEIEWGLRQVLAKL